MPGSSKSEPGASSDPQSSDPLPSDEATVLASPWGAGFDISALAAAVRRQQQSVLAQATSVEFVGPTKCAPAHPRGSLGEYLEQEGRLRAWLDELSEDGDRHSALSRHATALQAAVRGAAARGLSPRGIPQHRLSGEGTGAARPRVPSLRVPVPSLRVRWGAFWSSEEEDAVGRAILTERALKEVEALQRPRGGADPESGGGAAAAEAHAEPAEGRLGWVRNLTRDGKLFLTAVSVQVDAKTQDEALLALCTIPTPPRRWRACWRTRCCSRSPPTPTASRHSATSPRASCSWPPSSRT
jgi:hypothetical protein